MNSTPLFGIPGAPAAESAATILPLPFEGTVSYGGGTAAGPEAILEASAQIELWDDELDFDLDSLRWHTAPALEVRLGETAEEYIFRVEEAARALRRPGGLVVGIGGEHSLTPPLVRAAAADPADLSAITVVQIDAHPDLRSEYEGTACSHASAMRRLVERGARVIAVGIRSADRAEFEYGVKSGLVENYMARDLAVDPACGLRLTERLRGLTGPVYLTIDIDGLEVHLCPGTGTPQPGGLGWWQALGFLRALLLENRSLDLIGADLVETAPMRGTSVNEFTAARLLGKVLAYRFK